MNLLDLKDKFKKYFASASSNLGAWKTVATDKSLRQELPSAMAKNTTNKIRIANQNFNNQITTGTGFWGTPLSDQPIIKKISSKTTPIVNKLTSFQPLEETLPQQVVNKIPNQVRPMAEAISKVQQFPRVAVSRYLLGSEETRQQKANNTRRLAELERNFASNPKEFMGSEDWNEYLNLSIERATPFALAIGGVKNVSNWRQVGAAMPEDTARSILKVKKSATEQQINEAYKKFAAKNHPDIGGDPKAFELAKGARDVLLSKIKPKVTTGPLILGSGEKAANAKIGALPKTQIPSSAPAAPITIKAPTTEGTVRIGEKTSLNKPVQTKYNLETRGTPVYRGTVGMGEINNIPKHYDNMYQANYGSLWTDTPKDAEKYARGYSVATGRAGMRPIGNEPFIIEGRKLKDGSVIPIKATNLDTKEVINFTANLQSSQVIQEATGQPSANIKVVAPQGNLKTRGFVESVQEAPNVLEPVKANVSGRYRVKSNPKLMGEAEALLQNGVALDLKKVDNIDSKVTATIQEAINRQQNGDYEAAANLYNNLAKTGTELGRSVHAFSLLKKMSPEAIAKTAAARIQEYNSTALKKIPELTADQTAQLTRKVKEIDLLKDGSREKNIALHELEETIDSFIPSSITDKVITAWKSGLLTSLRTQERNFLSNIIRNLAETVKDVPASLADIGLATKTGQRTVTSTPQGIMAGAKELASKSTRQQMADIMNLGYDAREGIEKWDIRRTNWGKGKIEQLLKKYTDVVFRSLDAADKPFFNSAMARSLYNQAAAEAINQGKRGNKELIKKLVANPTSKMLERAISDANTATLRNKNTISGVASAIKRSLSKSEIGQLASEITMPFTGVPSAALGQTIKYSPIGLINGIRKVGKVATQDVPELQREAAQDFGRGVVGTAIFGLGAYLASKGLITGQPKDQTESRLWEAQGKQRNSILINGKWRSLNSIGPEAIIFLAGAKFNEEMTSPDGSGVRLVSNVGKDLLDQSFVTGIQGPVNAITDPARYAKSYAGQTLSSPIPNIIKDLSKATDQYSRESETVLDYVKQGVPGLRQTLEPRRDILGNKVEQAPSGLSAFYDLFNSRTPIDNRVVNEIGRLYEEEEAVVPAKLTNEQTIQGTKVKLTPEQLGEMKEAVGELATQNLTELINSPSYQRLSDDKKAKAIKNVYDDAKDEVKSNMTLKDLMPAKFEKSEDAPQNILQAIKIYGTGFFKDPKAVVNAVTTGQPVRKIRGDAVVLERAVGLSNIDQGDTNTQVDHIIPLSLGGDNSGGNLEIISTAENKAKAIVENYLINQLEEGNINRKEAQEKILNWRTELAKLPTEDRQRAEELLSQPKVEKITAPTATTAYSSSEALQKIAKKYTLVNESGTVTTIDLSDPLQAPTMTGEGELDKKLVSNYKSSITKRINDISKLYLDGQIGAKEANDAIVALKGIYQKIGGSTKKPKSITIKKLMAPKISLTANRPSATVPNIKISPSPNLKMSGYRVPKLTMPSETALPKIKISPAPTLTVGRYR